MRSWSRDAETVVREGLVADELFETLFEKGQGPGGWSVLVKEEEEYQTWGVAWVALERALGLIAEDATKSQSRDLALLAAEIAALLAALDRGARRLRPSLLANLR